MLALRRSARSGQNPDDLELRLELARRPEQDGLDPQLAGCLEVLLGVVDHQPRVRRQAETVEQSSVDGGVWLGNSFPTRDDGAVEPTEQRKALAAERIRFR